MSNQGTTVPPREIEVAAAPDGVTRAEHLPLKSYGTDNDLPNPLKFELPFNLELLSHLQWQFRKFELL